MAPEQDSKVDPRRQVASMLGVEELSLLQKQVLDLLRVPHAKEYFVGRQEVVEHVVAGPVQHFADINSGRATLSHGMRVQGVPGVGTSWLLRAAEEGLRAEGILVMTLDFASSNNPDESYLHKLNRVIEESGKEKGKPLTIILDRPSAVEANPGTASCLGQVLENLARSKPDLFLIWGDRSTGPAPNLRKLLWPGAFQLEKTFDFGDFFALHPFDLDTTFKQIMGAPHPEIAQHEERLHGSNLQGYSIEELWKICGGIPGVVDFLSQHNYSPDLAAQYVFQGIKPDLVPQLSAALAAFSVIEDGRLPDNDPVDLLQQMFSSIPGGANITREYCEDICGLLVTNRLLTWDSNHMVHQIQPDIRPVISHYMETKMGLWMACNYALTKYLESDMNIKELRQERLAAIAAQETKKKQLYPILFK